MSSNLRNVQIQIAPIIWFRCRKRIKVVRGYVCDKAFAPLIDVFDHCQVPALVEDLRKADRSITPVGFNYGKTVHKNTSLRSAQNAL